MNTYNTHRHTARPSRLRVTLARLGAWLDRHDDAVTLAVLALVVSLATTILVIGLVTDYALAITSALMVGSVVVMLSVVSAWFAYMVGTDRATRRVSCRYSRYMSEQSDKYERKLSRVTHERDIARREASRNAYALLTALEETDNA